MNRFRVGLIVLVVLMTVSFLAVAYIVKRPGGGGNAPVPEPVSYAKPTPDGSGVLVALGDPDTEAKLKGEYRRLADEVRAKYREPGLYRGDRLVYPLAGYSPDDQVFLSPDGRHVVRIEGEWWKTKAYPAGKRLPADVEKAQLDAVAVRCFTDGKLTHEYKLSDLVTDPERLPHSPEHILWPAGAVLNQQTGQFHLFTQDSNRITIDVTSGAITERAKNGLGNPITQSVMWVTIGLTVAAAAVIAWYTFFKKPAAHSSPRPTGADSAPVGRGEDGTSK